MREKLIEMLTRSDHGGIDYDLQADYLIANGVRLEEKQATSNTSEQFASDNNVGSKWIPVTERMPENGTEVLVFSRDGMEIASLFGNAWVDMNFRNCRDVTHWMPLPEPPKEEK